MLILKTIYNHSCEIIEVLTTKLGVDLALFQFLRLKKKDRYNRQEIPGRTTIFAFRVEARPCSPRHHLLSDSWVLVPCPELFHWEWMEQTEGEPSNLPASSAEGKNERKFAVTIFI